MSADYNPRELLIGVAARLMEDGTTAFIGTGIPMLAAAWTLRTSRRSRRNFAAPREPSPCAWVGKDSRPHPPESARSVNGVPRYRCGSTITLMDSLASATRRKPSPVSASPSRWVIISATGIRRARMRSSATVRS